MKADNFTKKLIASMKMLFIALFKLLRRIKRIHFKYFNRFKYWVYGVNYGRNLEVTNRTYLIKSQRSSTSIGDDFVFTNDDCFNPLSRNLRGCLRTHYPGSKITIGNNVGISSACIWAKESITIGNNVKIGGDCIILDSDCHNLDYKIRRSKEVNELGVMVDSYTANSASIVIEDDVMLGARCIVLKGVTIGARSIIGSGSVVTKSIPPDSIAAGNPCKVIKKINTLF